MQQTNTGRYLNEVFLEGKIKDINRALKFIFISVRASGECPFEATCSIKETIHDSFRAIYKRYYR